MFVVGGDGVADGIAPAVGAEGVDVFVLGEVDGLQLGLEHVGNGAGEAGFDVAADEVFGERFGGSRLGFFLGVVETEMRVAGDAWGAAAAAIFVRE
jgi:hypothetical protein